MAMYLDSVAVTDLFEVLLKIVTANRERNSEITSKFISNNKQLKKTL